MLKLTNEVKKKSNDQELTKYLINNCGFFLDYAGVRCSVWSTKCVVPCAECTLGQNQRAQGRLRICRDGSMSTFSESVDSNNVDTQAYPNHVC